MTPERYQRVRQVFLAACRLERVDQQTYLERACADDPSLRVEVEALLDHDQRSLPVEPCLNAAAALDLALPADGGVDLQAARDGGQLPQRIGHFRILRRLGEGGMGVVYEAEQENPQRIVALKVIRPGVASPQTLRRFNFEAQVLGRLQHPGIAQIHEAGTATVATGGAASERPYFAMELVRGLTLQDYVAAKALDTRARLELIARICDAVQHAHQKGVIHRDLKPGNIIVDDGGQPKILDFGVARVTGADVQVSTLLTEVGQVIGTIAYMSPEQVAGDLHALDTRADVYALGVMLYELLVDRVPLNLTGKSLAEAARAIAEDEPTALRTLNRALRGDVEAIVNKAIEKNKADRYDSAAALASDIRRYLADQPVSARPITTWYQLRKFARRNRTLVAGAATTCAALVFGLVGTASQAIRATYARNEAERAARVAEEQSAEAQRQAAIAQAVNDFLNEDLLAKAKPGELGRDATIRAALDAASERVDARFGDAPTVAAAVHLSLGDTYYALGEFKPAAAHLEKALELGRAHLGAGHADTLRAMSRLGLVYSNLARFEQAEELFKAAIAGRARLWGEDDHQTLATMNNLALLYLKREQLAQAEAVSRRVLELNARRRADDSENAATAMANLATVFERQERYAEAEPLYRRVLETKRGIWGSDAPVTLSLMQSLGTLYARMGRYDAAEPLLRETLTLQRRVLGEEHPRTLSTLNTLAVLYKNAGYYESAERLLRETLETKRRVLGPEHPNTLNTLSSLARLCADQGRYSEAQTLIEQVVEVRRRVMPEHPSTTTALTTLAEVHLRQGRIDDAETLACESYDRLLVLRGPAHSDTQLAAGLIAEIYAIRGDAKQAEQWAELSGKPAGHEPVTRLRNE